ncbi:hypothetical protein [Gloeothece verrucosa]|uniref:Uncharacterized protein n=1 Tax=Gloeothece verrucosa (strain PCC 7822) TaxID=497965 RepID=E0U6X6_GLOV7|nr:hypothetical protein [Gloeothece verrucosa]ADN16013.1 hypothetical protein Cyan7822_4093 [Gloeothece verrucosa PCC 7822]
MERERLRPWIRLDKDLYKILKVKAMEADTDLESFLGELLDLGYGARYGV